MKTPGPRKESISEVRLDLASAKILVWIASVGRDAERTAEAHICFFDLYQKLADYHYRYGHTAAPASFKRKLTSIIVSVVAMGLPTLQRWGCRARGAGSPPRSFSALLAITPHRQTLRADGP